MNLQVSKVGHDEVQNLRDLSIRTFFDTYSSCNTHENMELYLSNDLSIEQLTKELNDPEAEFYFALADDQAVGFLKVNHRPYSIMDQNQKGMEIERIYVLKDFQGKAIGKFLLDQATRISEEINCNYIWLGVWEHNINAQKFYKKNGFSEIGEQIFMLGNDKQKDLILIKNI